MFGIISSLLGAKVGPKVSEEQGQTKNPEGRRRKKGNGMSEFSSYYGRPVVKKPHWVWPVWTYFWLGGIAGGASAIATVVELFGDKERDRSIVRAGRYISLAGLMVSPVLLIIDLQRPERFHHMLRVLKLRSPLSVGTYILTATGILSGVNAARQVVEDGFIPEDNFLGQFPMAASNSVTQALQGVGGIGVGGYTGVLLTATAMPLWAENDTVLPPLFLSSAFSTGAAAITLARALGGVDESELHRLDEIERAAILSELGLIAFGALKTKPEVRQYLMKGKPGVAFGGAVLQGMLIPLLLQLLAPKHGKLARFFAVLTSLFVLAGGFNLRYSVIEGGKASGDDPDAYHAVTRGEARPTPEEQARAGAKLKAQSQGVRS
jgi:formate-dependent nitrite reductase membrane component NrfD